MKKDIENQNYEELSKIQIFEKIKEDLNPIQESLSEKKITVEEAKYELKKINEWLQLTKLENKDKKEIWKAFEKLMKLEKDIDENSLKSEVERIKNLLEILTRKDLKKLGDSIQKKHIPWQIEQKSQKEIQHLTDADKWRKESSNNLELTIHEASQDTNPWARKIGERMENLMA